MKLLIIEDEKDILNALKRGFQQKKYAVDIAEDGDNGLYLSEINDYDVIILDLNLPNKDGLEILKEIRKNNDYQRVIILSARSLISDKITGFDIGANDYLTKPFEFLELEARVRSLIKREFKQKNDIINIGKLIVNISKKVISFDDKVIDFRSKEYAILEYLALNKGKVVTQEELLEHVWNGDVDLFSSSVKVHISNIRNKLKELSKEEFIETIRGSGYVIREK